VFLRPPNGWKQAETSRATRGCVREVLLERRLILPTSSLAQIVALARQVVAAAAEGAEYPHLASFEHLTEAANWLTLREDGPLWFRGFAKWRQGEGQRNVKTLSRELAPDGITVNNVLPGFTATERLDYLFEQRAAKAGRTKEEMAEAARASVPAGRFAQPEEIAFAVAFLASPQAAYVNGVSLAVDGGRTGCL
jgi:hypothetical protein